jgi:photosystem II stability/assembly factor-like uncharacterized protein
MFRSPLLIIALIAVAGLGQSASSQISAASQSADRPSRHNRFQSPTLTPQTSGTTNRLQAISPVSTEVVWASGVGGTYVKTTNGGATWEVGVVRGAETLQFRDVQGVSGSVAYLLSAGTGTDSRIYKTEDGGDSWTLQFQNQDPNAFYDCFAFWTPKRGITTSDSVNGRFPVIRTLNGRTWEDIGDRLPTALPGEASFAASGTCVATQGSRRAWIGTGGSVMGRILATTDGGNTWAAYPTPIVQGTSTSGVISVDFRDAKHGILGGGELLAPTAFADTAARSRDGGKTWLLVGRTPFPGAIYGLSYVREIRRLDDSNDAEEKVAKADEDRDVASPTRSVVATGPSGAAWSPDEGDTWFLLPGVANYWAVAFASPDAGWLVGTGGRILKISF